MCHAEHGDAPVGCKGVVSGVTSSYTTPGPGQVKGTPPYTTLRGTIAGIINKQQIRNLPPFSPNTQARIFLAF